LRSQQGQQLSVIQYAVTHPVAGQQALQGSLLFLETGAFLQQWRQLALGTHHSLLAALSTQLTERQQAPSIRQ
jgi:hypothetical protein